MPPAGPVDDMANPNENVEVQSAALQELGKCYTVQKTLEIFRGVMGMSDVTQRMSQRIGTESENIFKKVANHRYGKKADQGIAKMTMMIRDQTVSLGLDCFVCKQDGRQECIHSEFTRLCMKLFHLFFRFFLPLMFLRWGIDIMLLCSEATLAFFEDTVRLQHSSHPATTMAEQGTSQTPPAMAEQGTSQTPAATTQSVTKSPVGTPQKSPEKSLEKSPEKSPLLSNRQPSSPKENPVEALQEKAAEVVESAQALAENVAGEVAEQAQDLRRASCRVRYNTSCWFRRTFKYIVSITYTYYYMVVVFFVLPYLNIQVLLWAYLSATVHRLAGLEEFANEYEKKRKTFIYFHLLGVKPDKINHRQLSKNEWLVDHVFDYAAGELSRYPFIGLTFDIFGMKRPVKIVRAVAKSVKAIFRKRQLPAYLNEDPNYKEENDPDYEPEDEISDEPLEYDSHDETSPMASGEDGTESVQDEPMHMESASTLKETRYQNTTSRDRAPKKETTPSPRWRRSRGKRNKKPHMDESGSLPTTDIVYNKKTSFQSKKNHGKSGGDRHGGPKSHPKSCLLPRVNKLIDKASKTCRERPKLEVEEKQEVGSRKSMEKKTLECTETASNEVEAQETRIKDKAESESVMVETAEETVKQEILTLNELATEMRNFVDDALLRDSILDEVIIENILQNVAERKMGNSVEMQSNTPETEKGPELELKDPNISQLNSGESVEESRSEEKPTAPTIGKPKSPEKNLEDEQDVFVGIGGLRGQPQTQKNHNSWNPGLDIRKCVETAVGEITSQTECEAGLKETDAVQKVELGSQDDREKVKSRSASEILDEENVNPLLKSPDKTATYFTETQNVTGFVPIHERAETSPYQEHVEKKRNTVSLEMSGSTDVDTGFSVPEDDSLNTP